MTYLLLEILRTPFHTVFVFSIAEFPCDFLSSHENRFPTGFHSRRRLDLSSCLIYAVKDTSVSAFQTAFYSRLPRLLLIHSSHPTVRRPIRRFPPGVPLSPSASSVFLTHLRREGHVRLGLLVC